MKNFKLSTALHIALLLVLVTSCKKYGINEPDGFDDGSGNQTSITIDTNIAAIDRSAYAQARVFPGLVDPAERRVMDTTFTMDLSFDNQTANVLRISVAPRPQFSTGFYAAPGELIKLVVPPGVNGLTMQIGGHTDNLSGMSPLLRDPLIYMRKVLYPGVNYVRNRYGGTIYINASFSIPQPVEFKISNACVSPDFIVDQTTDEQFFAKVKASKVPWLELRSKKVIFLVPKDSVLRALTPGYREPLQPTTLMRKWNDVFELDYNGWMGLSDNAPNPIDRSPQGAWRGALDIQITNGVAHNGFPFMAVLYQRWFEAFSSVRAVSTSDIMWGPYHEFGHNCQQSIWSWSSLGETTNNLFSFKVAKRLNDVGPLQIKYTDLHPALPIEFPKALAYASKIGGGKNFETDLATASPFAKIAPFVQLFEKYGYDLMTYLYAQGRRAPRLPNNDQDKRDFFYEKACEYAQQDIIPFFEAWGMQVSNISKNKISNRFPLMTKDYWNYDPLQNTGGTANINLNNFRLITANSAASANPATLMFDGNDATNWLSNGALPYTLDLDKLFTNNITATTTAKGLYFVPIAATTGRIKDIEVLTSTNGVDYTSIGNFQIPNQATRYNLNFPSPVNNRYFRVIVKNNWTNTALAALAELGTIY